MLVSLKSFQNHGRNSTKDLIAEKYLFITDLSYLPCYTCAAVKDALIQTPHQSHTLLQTQAGHSSVAIFLASMNNFFGNL